MPVCVRYSVPIGTELRCVRKECGKETGRLVQLGSPGVESKTRHEITKAGWQTACRKVNKIP